MKINPEKIKINIKQKPIYHFGTSVTSKEKRAIKQAFETDLKSALETLASEGGTETIKES